MAALVSGFEAEPCRIGAKLARLSPPGTVQEHGARLRDRDDAGAGGLRQRLPDSPHGFQRQRRRGTQQRSDQRRPRRRRGAPFDRPRGDDRDRHRLRAAVCRGRRRARRRGDGRRQADEAGRGPSGQRRRHGAHSARRPEQRRRRAVDVEGRPQRRSDEVRRVGGADGPRRHDRTAAAVRRPRQLVVRIRAGPPVHAARAEAAVHRADVAQALSVGRAVAGRAGPVAGDSPLDEPSTRSNRCSTT